MVCKRLHQDLYRMIKELLAAAWIDYDGDPSEENLGNLMLMKSEYEDECERLESVSSRG